ncbi:EVI5 [Lepeophtheirus salmonis]|uniref:EVI5 n=1 Tax=Lepeophtheirus salmonis TaxID=72036 RepID=A0A7R8CD90_LEPSM|nr:EVI5 [Lepeophtheirus salmonis]CAF2778693.1 EVI5 [Lepeophtheirus salmonis]
MQLSESKLIETDAKSLNSLKSGSGHSRRSSDTSQISITSGTSSNVTVSSQPEQSPAHDPEEDLWSYWGKIISEWESGSRKKVPNFKELVRKGIPHHFRGIAWQLLCGAHDLHVKKVIRRDMARTYPEHEFFKKKDGIGQEALFNVMKAYSIHDREVGYCQGSAFIVGLLLMQMPEEESFAVLVKIMQEYRMREMFKPSMAELGLCMYQLDMLLQEHVPDVYAHFQSQSVHTNLYASSWFLTLFTTSLPINLSCRVMDCFLSEGTEVIFRLALALIILGRHDLLVEDMEGVIRYFQKDMPAKFDAEPNNEYTTMKTKEKEDEIELKRLRTENRLLRQRVDLLETESSELADRLIQGQVTRAEVEEHTFAIKRELAAIKQHDIDTNAKLEEAKDQITTLSEIVESSSKPSSMEEEVFLKSEIIKQKEEMISCLQDELIKRRKKKKLREIIPENEVASLQEELAASKLREAEAQLALKDLRISVTELQGLWTKHLKRRADEKANDPDSSSFRSGFNINSNGDVVSSNTTSSITMPSTPKKLLGTLLDPVGVVNAKSEAARLEEELMTSRLVEVEGQAQIKTLELQVMTLETQNQVIANQLKRQGDEVTSLQDDVDKKNGFESELRVQLKESHRKYTDLETCMKEEIILEYKNQEILTEGNLASSIRQSDKVRELQDTIASLRAQVTRLSLMNSKLSKSLSLHNLAMSFSCSSSSSSSSLSTPSTTPNRVESPSTAHLRLNLSASLQRLPSSSSSSS